MLKPIVVLYNLIEATRKKREMALGFHLKKYACNLLINRITNGDLRNDFVFVKLSFQKLIFVCGFAIA